MIAIEDVTFTPEMAAETIRILRTVTISGQSAEQFLTLIQSLQRIADGKDMVVEVNESGGHNG